MSGAIRFHPKADGVLVVWPGGECRFLTTWERVGLAMGWTKPDGFSASPSGAERLQKAAPAKPSGE